MAAEALKKKKWLPVISEQFDNQTLGETLVLENEEAVGRRIDVNLMTLTKSPKKQNMNLLFEVTQVAEGKAQTRPLEFVLQPASIKRLVRTGRDRVDDSFVVKCKDGLFARVKTLFITKAHTPNALQTKLRVVSYTLVKKYAATVSFEQLIKDAVEGKIQKEMKDKTAKVVALRNCEVRVISRLESYTTKVKRAEAIEQVKEIEVAQEE
jgi:ribosomal protein S3AE